MLMMILCQEVVYELYITSNFIYYFRNVEIYMNFPQRVVLHELSVTCNSINISVPCSLFMISP